VIGIGADDVEGLLERHLDLESQTIEADDVQGGQGQVRAHQQDGAALRMEYHDEADEDAGGAPQQVGGSGAEDHVLLAIDGAGCLLEPAGILEQRCELDLLAVFCRSALGPRPVQRRGCRREESHAVAFDPREPVVPLGQQSADNLAGGIVGVGREVERLLQCQGIEQPDHLVQQGWLVAVGKHGAFVDATGQRQGKYAGQGLGEHSHRLAGVAEDVLRHVV